MLDFWTKLHAWLRVVFYSFSFFLCFITVLHIYGSRKSKLLQAFWDTFTMRLKDRRIIRRLVFSHVFFILSEIEVIVVPSYAVHTLSRFYTNICALLKLLILLFHFVNNCGYYLDSQIEISFIYLTYIWTTKANFILHT